MQQNIPSQKLFHLQVLSPEKIPLKCLIMIIKQVQSDTVAVDYMTSANCSEEIVQHSVVYKLIMLFKRHSLFSQKNKNIV